MTSDLPEQQPGGGDFLPGSRSVGEKGFHAVYQVGNLALGQSLVSTSAADVVATTQDPTRSIEADPAIARHAPGLGSVAQVSLI